MLKSLKTVFILSFMVTGATGAFAEKLGLGRAALPEEIAAWDWDVSPDGTGFPIGSGDAINGEEIFADQCAVCHGDFAEGMGRWPVLAGGIDTLADDDPVKTVGSYWPYISTVIDYVKRSMPFGNAGSLTNDEVYAIVAYILYSNDLIEDDFVLSNETALDVDLPNADGFILDDRAKTEYAAWSGIEPCMSDCKDEVKITMRARVIDVTPEVETTKTVQGQNVINTTPSAASQTKEEPQEPVLLASFDADLAAAGKKVFKKCKSCHQVGENAKNRTGPHLNGVIGASAGAVEKFKYSKALKKAADGGLVWGEEELAGFLKKPKKYLKGTKMSFAGLKKDKDIAAVIEYLKTFEK